MSLSTIRTSLLCALLAAPSAASFAEDWPGWRGTSRDGKSTETGLLASWPEGGPPLAWKASGIGSGYSSLAVAGDRIFTMGDLEDAQYALALSRADGTILWKTKVGQAWKDEYLGPRSTPTIAGGNVYVLTTDGDLYCLEEATGKEVWRRNVVEDFGGRLMLAMGQYMWKYAESPLVDGDRVVVTPGSPEAAMVALDRRTGKEIWRAALPADLGEAGRDGTGYSSIVISEGAGVKQYVQLIGRGLIGVAAKDGRFLWGYNRIANGTANIPTPLIQGDYVFTSTAYQTGAALLRLHSSGDGVRAEEVYFLDSTKMQNHHGGMILHDGYVYSGTGHNKGFPLAVRFATGEVAWGPERNDGSGSAAIAYADGRIYFRYQDGRMILVEATPGGYREHGTFVIPNVTHESWSHPVISDGRLYLREQETLYVYDIRAGEKKQGAGAS